MKGTVKSIDVISVRLVVTDKETNRDATVTLNQQTQVNAAGKPIAADATNRFESIAVGSEVTVNPDGAPAQTVEVEAVSVHSDKPLAREPAFASHKPAAMQHGK